ncbi:MAG: hypothetical protein R3A12_18525 [Ignavibacteria bacterium]
MNRDGVIDLDDLIDTYNAGNVFLNGYIVQDCNGDSVVDLSDVLIIFNNAQLFGQCDNTLIIFFTSSILCIGKLAILIWDSLSVL